LASPFTQALKLGQPTSEFDHGPRPGRRFFHQMFLPRQKEETQELLLSGGSSKIFGGMTIVYVLFAFAWSLMTNIMAMFESMACLTIACGKCCFVSEIRTFTCTSKT
jgi:hypothetical protein